MIEIQLPVDTGYVGAVTLIERKMLYPMTPRSSQSEDAVFQGQAQIHKI